MRSSLKETQPISIEDARKRRAKKAKQARPVIDELPYNDEIEAFCEQYGISAGVRHLLSILRSYMNRQRKFCYPSIKTLAGKMGRHRTTILNYVKQAKDLGLISIENRRRGRQWGSNVYRFLFPFTPLQGRKLRPSEDVLRVAKSDPSKQEKQTRKEKTSSKQVATRQDIFLKKKGNSNLMEWSCNQVLIRRQKISNSRVDC